jgi:hypothetical protein
MNTPGLPHGMCSTHKDIINSDLLAFIEAEAPRKAPRPPPAGLRPEAQP